MAREVRTAQLGSLVDELLTGVIGRRCYDATRRQEDRLADYRTI
jgi:hypothetical protein